MPVGIGLAGDGQGDVVRSSVVLGLGKETGTLDLPVLDRSDILYTPSG